MRSRILELCYLHLEISYIHYKMYCEMLVKKTGAIVYDEKTAEGMKKLLDTMKELYKTEGMPEDG